jgi:hypothetical protein
MQNRAQGPKPLHKVQWLQGAAATRSTCLECGDRIDPDLCRRELSLGCPVMQVNCLGSLGEGASGLRYPRPWSGIWGRKVNDGRSRIGNHNEATGFGQAVDLSCADAQMFASEVGAVGMKAVPRFRRAGLRMSLQQRRRSIGCSSPGSRTGQNI